MNYIYNQYDHIVRSVEKRQEVKTLRLQRQTKKKYSFYQNLQSAILKNEGLSKKQKASGLVRSLGLKIPVKFPNYLVLEECNMLVQDITNS